MKLGKLKYSGYYWPKRLQKESQEMPSQITNNQKKTMSGFIGLNIDPSDLEKLDIMKEYLLDKKVIKKDSRSEAVRWCLDLGFSTVKIMMEQDLGIVNAEVMSQP